MIKDITLLDTTTYTDDDYEFLYDDELDLVKDELAQAVKAYEKRYNTKVVGYLQLATRSSRYGSICNNGAHGFRYVDTIDKLFEVDCYDFNVAITSEGLAINYYDHDGTNYTMLKFITANMIKGYDDSVYYDEAGDYVEEHIVPKAKPTARCWFSKVL